MSLSNQRSTGIRTQVITCVMLAMIQLKAKMKNEFKMKKRAQRMMLLEKIPRLPWTVLLIYVITKR